MLPPPQRERVGARVTASLNLFDAIGEPGDPPGSRISVKRSLGDGFMQYRSGLTKRGTGKFRVLFFQSGFHFFQRRFHVAQHQTIALIPFNRLPSPFNCRFMLEGHTSPPV